MKKYLPLRFGTLDIVFSVIQLLYFILFYFYKSGAMTLDFSFGSVILLVYSFITLNLFVRLLASATSGYRVLHVAAGISAVFIFQYMLSYHYVTASPVGYEIVSGNFGEAFSGNALDVLIKSVDKSGMHVAIFVVLLLVVLEFTHRIISRYRERGRLAAKTGVSLFLYLAVIVLPLGTYDDITYFFKTAFEYHFDNSYISASGYAPGEYPFIKKQTAMYSDNGNLPNIFIIFMESNNGKFVDYRTPDGREVTPFFNSLKNKGLYVEKFYGNSIQTCRGHIATFASLVPSFRGKIYKNYVNVRVRLLPDVLRDLGYNTVYFKSNSDIHFDNTHNYLTNHGFDIVSSITPYLRSSDLVHSMGWGVHDNIFYERFFDYLDETYIKKKGKKPVFAALATVTNHMKFDFVPEKQRHLYKAPRNMKEAYSNTMFLADRYLKTFFKELKKRQYLDNSIVIVLGDHSFPMGEHGFYHNEISFYDEFFRIPFILLWENHIQPRKIQNAVYSQMDIAPTLLDLIGVRPERSHFQGVSILEDVNKKHPVYLVQPYNGIFLSVIRYPLKYVRHLRTGAEYIFDLELDPREANNLIDKYRDTDIYTEFDNGIKYIFMNQALLDNDGIWHD